MKAADVGRLDFCDQSFVFLCLAKLPKHWQQLAFDEYLERLKKSRRDANIYLRKLVEPLSGLLDIAAGDDDLQKLAAECAADCAAWRADSVSCGWLGLKSRGDPLRRPVALCLSYAVRFPIEFDLDGQWSRLVCPVWWLRKLRKSHARAREYAAIRAGLVHRKAAVYCSDDTVQRRGEQVRRNKTLMDGIEMVSESGEVATLSELAAAGMANAKNRRAELMTRIAGFEAAAVAAHRVADFSTLTCPSRMHSHLSTGARNPKYDGTSPAQAQRHLSDMWARVRAQLARDGVRVFGLRVAEPHHDGCPHWHMILFVKPSQLVGLRKVLRAHFLAVDGDEAGAKKNRVKFVRIDPRRGSAAGYVAKYVSKNIGGIEGDFCDEGGGSSVEVWQRVEAWASTWAIRQFQQIGGHLVSVWRELRRVSEDGARAAGGVLLAAWNTVQRKGEQRASWADYLEVMGGIDCPPLSGSVALAVDYETVRGAYGETLARRVLGVCERGAVAYVESNRERWQVLRTAAVAPLGHV